MTSSSINSVSLMNLAKLAYLRHYHSLFHSSIHILVPFTVLHLRSDLSSYYVRGYQNLVAKINLVTVYPTNWECSSAVSPGIVHNGTGRKCRMHWNGL